MTTTLSKYITNYSCFDSSSDSGEESIETNNMFTNSTWPIVKIIFRFDFRLDSAPMSPP